MKPQSLSIALAVSLAGCAPTESPRSPEEVRGPEPRTEQGSAKSAPPPIRIARADLELDGDPGPFKTNWVLTEPEPGLVLATLQLEAERPAPLPELTVRFSTPSVGVAGNWTPRVQVDRVSRWGNRVTSRATTNAPLLSHYDADGNNRITMALSDALGRVDLGSYVREEDKRYHFSVRLFAERVPATRGYEATLRIDTRQIPYQDAIGEVARWWAGQPGYEPAPTPEAARGPVYSTWYNFHQSLDAGVLLEELRLAKQLGYDTVIVDDGWQTTDTARGYAYTGDWEPDGIPDFPGFVDRVHDLGVKFVLWYSLPFVGKHAKVRAKFDGKYLRYHEDLGAYTLDPRYPEVREHIISTYEGAMEKWGVDGFKIDFIGRFVADETTVLTAEGGRDVATVNEAVDRLMTDIMSRLRAANPEVMIEFRQPYIGPLMRKYGNMFRATDCPNDAVINRIRTLDLRLLAGETAVHSDMFTWHHQESVERAALQILGVMFSVPQLSVRIAELPEAHVDMIRFWTGYWRENRDTLLGGQLEPRGPDMLYPEVWARTPNKAIVALYAPRVVELPPSIREVDLINATPDGAVVLRATAELGARRLRSFDATGKLVGDEVRTLNMGVHEVAVAPSGLLRISAPG